MKRFCLFLLAALVLATVASIRWNPMPLEEKLVRIQAKSAFPDLVRTLEDEPIEVLATLVDYRGDKVLLLKAQAAVLERPQLARRILPLYGHEPEFRTILRLHGTSVLLPIGYFLDYGVGMLSAAEYASRQASAVKHAVARLWGSTTSPGIDAEAGSSDTDEELTPEQRGWYAVHFIRAEGHDFLGQFAMDAEGRVQWIQTERVLEGLTALLASGVRTLEIKARTGEAVDAGDIGWATLDGAAFLGAAYLLRAGKTASSTARTARVANVSSRAAHHTARAARLKQAGLEALRFAKWPAILATGYVIAVHPSLIGDVLAGAADVLGLPTVAVQLVGWTLILLPLLLVASWVGRLFARPLGASLRWIAARPGQIRR